MIKIDKEYRAFSNGDYITIPAGEIKTLVLSPENDIIINRLSQYVDNGDLGDIRAKIIINGRPLVSNDIPVNLKAFGSEYNFKYPVLLKKGYNVQIQYENSGVTEVYINALFEGYTKLNNDITIEKPIENIFLLDDLYTVGAGEEFRKDVTLTQTLAIEEIHLWTDTALDKDLWLNIRYEGKDIYDDRISSLFLENHKLCLKNNSFHENRKFYAPIFLEKGKVLTIIAKNETGGDIKVNPVMLGVSDGV